MAKVDKIVIKTILMVGIHFGVTGCNWDSFFINLVFFNQKISTYPKHITGYIIHFSQMFNY